MGNSDFVNHYLDLEEKKKEKKGGICYVLTAFYILLYSRPGLSLLAVCDISITMKILPP